MEVEKRKRLNISEIPGKRLNSPEISGKKVRAAAEEAGKSGNPAEEAAEVVAEEEVDEFFAILKRIRVAVKYFGRVNNEESGGRRAAAAAARPWNPIFRREEEKETVLENTGLDLNAEPVSPTRKPE